MYNVQTCTFTFVLPTTHRRAGYVGTPTGPVPSDSIQDRARYNLRNKVPCFAPFFQPKLNSSTFEPDAPEKPEVCPMVGVQVVRLPAPPRVQQRGLRRLAAGAARAACPPKASFAGAGQAAAPSPTPAAAQNQRFSAGNFPAEMESSER